MTTPAEIYEALLDAVTEHGIAQSKLAQPITPDTDYAALVQASANHYSNVISLAGQLRDLAEKAR